MALYDAMFLVNTFNRTGHFPSAESGVVAGRSDDEQIYLPVTLESELFGPIVQAAGGIGITIPTTITGSRNTRSMTVAGEVAITGAPAGAASSRSADGTHAARARRPGTLGLRP